jgi:hypothetical protein
MYWHNEQITILVHITYTLNPNWNSENEEPLLVKEIHYYMSDDRAHNSLFVKGVHVVEEAFTDPDGNNYVLGDVVFSDLWYERLKEGSCTYLLRNDREPSTVYSHLVLISKFSLPLIAHFIKNRLSGFELQIEVKELIEEAYTAAVSLD